MKNKIARRSFLTSTVKAGALLPMLVVPEVLMADTPDQLSRQAVAYTAANIPDRIILTLTEKPDTSVTINWRTDYDTMESWAELAAADAHPEFVVKTTKLKSLMTAFQFENLKARHHRVTIENLIPDTLYIYRVGQNDSWSEWLQFRTAKANNPGKANLSFIYLGDAQVGIRPLWSRVIRKAFAASPDAGLIIHAGDLVNRANKDEEWGDWFAAGNYLHGTVPVMVTPGNHEYTHEDGKPHLSVYWKQQFGVPANGPEEDYLNGSCYYADVQGVRFISLNTMMIEEALSPESIDAQVSWLHKVLENNKQQWTCVTMHHPVFSTSKGRNNLHVRKHLKPVFDQYKVDLVLQGHDHAYGRGMVKIPLTNGSKNEHSATAYVVSVSGSKMYETESYEWADLISGHLQLYHIINVDNTVLSFRSYMATGEFHDGFDLVKQEGRINKFIEKRKA
jgi:acid phosphatase type 7